MVVLLEDGATTFVAEMNQFTPRHGALEVRQRAVETGHRLARHELAAEVVPPATGRDHVVLRLAVAVVPAAEVVDGGRGHLQAGEAAETALPVGQRAAGRDGA